MEVIDGAATGTENDLIGIELEICGTGEGALRGVIVEEVADIAGHVIVFTDDDWIGEAVWFVVFFWVGSWGLLCLRGLRG